MVLCYDQCGFGQIGKFDMLYSMVDYVDDVVVLMDVVGWDWVVVFGVLFGGLVVQEFVW